MEVSMKRLFTTAMIVGLILGVRSAQAEDASVQASSASPNNRVKVNAQVHGDGAGRVKDDFIMLASPNGFAPETIEFTPDGHGNMVFTSTAPVRTEKGAFLGIYATRARPF